MKLIAINGSPRRNGNTATLLHKALEGAAAAGAETECIDLYTLNYKGCISCFSCKRKDKEHGHCAIKDDLTPILEKVREADAVIFGSPIYFMNLTSGLQAFLERFFFPLTIYSREIPTVLGKKMPSAFVYTMNATEQQGEEYHLKNSLLFYEMAASTLLGMMPRRLFAYNTVQFNDYSKYESSMFNEAEKKAYRQEHWPKELQQAYELGQALIKEAKG